MEHWKKVIGYENIYSVSNLGNVRRDKPANGATVGRILKPVKVGCGYDTVVLSENGIHCRKYIHALVATSFIGARDFNLEINHKDGNKSNNRIENLEYVTRSQNEKHAYRIGLKKPLASNSKLTKEDVICIRALHHSGYKQRHIMDKFNISSSQVSKIVNNIQWVTAH